jgi:hypothetical protein
MRQADVRVCFNSIQRAKARDAGLAPSFNCAYLEKSLRALLSVVW